MSRFRFHLDYHMKGLSAILFIILLFIIILFAVFFLFSSSPESYVEIQLDENITALVNENSNVEFDVVESNSSKIVEISDEISGNLIATVSVPINSDGLLGKITASLDQTSSSSSSSGGSVSSSSSGKSIVHIEDSDLDLEKTLYVPRIEGQTRVHICEGATEEAEVYDGCIQEESVTGEYILRRGDPQLSISDDGDYWIVNGITGTGGYGENISVDCYNGTGTLQNVTLCDVNHYNYTTTIVTEKFGPAHIINISRNVQNGVKKNNALYDKISEVYPGDFIDFMVEDSGAVFRDVLFLNRFMFLYNKSGVRYNMTTTNADSTNCGIINPGLGTGVECIMNNTDVSIKIEYYSKPQTSKPVIFYETTNIGVSILEQIEYYSYYDFDINFYSGDETRDDFDAVIIHSDQSTTVEGIQKEGVVVCDTKGLPNEIELTSCSEAAGDSFILRQQIKSPTGDEVLGGLATEFSSDQVTLIEEAFANPSTDTDGLREVPPAKIDSSGSGGVLNSADAVTAISLTAGTLSPGERFSKYIAPLSAKTDESYINVVNEDVPGTPIRIDNVVARNLSGSVVESAGAYYPLNITGDLANTGGVALTDLSVNCTIKDGSLDIVLDQNGTMNISSTEPVRTFACDTLVNQDNSLAPDDYTLIFTATYDSILENGTGNLTIVPDYEGNITNSLDDTTYLCGETVQVTSNVTNIGNTNFTGVFDVDLFTTEGTFVENIATISNLNLGKDESNQTLVQKTITECSEIPVNYTVRSSFNVTDQDEGLELRTADSTYLTDDVVEPSITLNSPADGIYTLSTVTFNWTSTDDNDLNPYCNLTIDDDVNVSNIETTGGSPKTQTVSSLSETTHYWNLTCWDNVNNTNTSLTSSFTSDVSFPSMSNFNIYSLDSSSNVIGGEASYTIDNLEQIEYLQVNFTLSDVAGIDGDISLFFTANGTNACSLGNNQSSSCYSYPNFIEYQNGSTTSTYDAVNGNQGDSISCTYTGNDNERQYSCIIDEHYNPNVWKHYPYNFSDLKWQSGANEQLNNHSVWKVELDTSMVPLDADYYKVDFRVNPIDNPTQKLFVFFCNSSYSTGDPEDAEECQLVTGKYSNEFQDDGTKFRALFTNDLISSLGDLRYVLIHTKELDGYFAMKTYKYEGTDSVRVEISTDHGGSYYPLSDGYETDLNINWFYDVVDSNPTQTIFRVESLDDLGNFGNSSNQILTWNVLDYNIVPVMNLNYPRINNVISGPEDINWTLVDANNDNLLIDINLDGTSGTTVIANDLSGSSSTFNWDTKEVDNGEYNLTIVGCETGTTELYCNNETIAITVYNTNPSVTNISINDSDSILRSTDSINITVNITDDKEISSAYVKGSSMSQIGTTDIWTLVTTPSSLGCSGTSCTLNFNVTEADGNVNDTESITIIIDDVVPSVSNLVVDDSDNVVKSSDTLQFNVTVTDTNTISSVYLSNDSSLEMSNVGGNLYQLTTTASSLGCSAVDGSCKLTVTATDVVGNVNSTTTLTLTIDNVVPVVSNLVVDDLDNIVKSSDTLQFNVTVTDSNTISSVYLANDSSLEMSNVGGDLYQLTTTASSLGCSSVDGVCELTVTATDLIGNVNNSITLTLTVDDIVPAVSNLQVDDADNYITSSDTLNFTVIVTDSNTISSVTLNGSSMAHIGSNVYSLITDLSSFSCTGDTSCELTVTATDVAGNVNSIETITFTVDDVVPSVSNLVVDDSDNYVTASQSLQFNVTVSDSNTISSVYLANDSSLEMSNVGGNLYQLTTTASSLGCSSVDGSCELTVTATDIAGNVNSTTTLTLTVDDIVPTVSNLVVNDSDNIVRSSDSLQFNVTVTDSNTISSVYLANDSSLEMSNVGGNLYQLTTTASALGCSAVDGSCEFTVTATDLIGNVNSTITLTLTIDDVIPSVTSFSVDDADNYVTSSDTLNFTVTVIDSNTLISVTLNGTSMTHIGSNVYSLVTDLSSFSCTGDTSCELTVTATDIAGNVNNTATLTLTVDDVVPAVSNLVVDDSDNVVKSSDTLQFNVTVSDSNTISSIYLSNDSSLEMTDAGGNLYQLTSTASALGCSAVDGSCELTVTATDITGNVNSTTTLTLTIDDVVPSVNNLVVDDSDNIVKSGDSLQFNVTVTDGNTISSVYLANDSSLEMSNVGGNLYQLTTTASALGCSAVDGNCKLTVTATDLIGNVNSSTTLILSIDDVVPAVSNLVVDDYDNYVTGSQSLQFNVTVTDGNTISSVYLANDSSLEMSNVSGNLYQLTTTASALGCSAVDGNCELTVTATDVVNNINSTTTMILTIDNINPAVSNLVINDADDVVRSTDSIQFNVTVSDSNSISSVYLANDSSLEMNNVGGNLYQLTTTASALGCSAVDGSCELTVTATDAIGNSNTTTTLTLTIDDVVPAVSNLQVDDSDNYVTSSDTLNFTVTVIDSNTLSSVTLNGTSMAHIGSNVYSLVTDMSSFSCTGDTSCELIVTATDVVGNVNNSVTITLIVDDNAPSISSVIISPSSGVTHTSSQTYQFNATITDSNDFETLALEFDGVNYTSLSNSSNEYYKSFENLPSGSYSYKWIAIDVMGNKAESSGTYVINKVTTSVTLSITPTTIVDYPTWTNASCNVDNSEVEIKLYRNNVEVSNPHYVRPNIGDYDYVCSTSGSQNYSSASDSSTLSVQNHGAILKSIKSELETVLEDNLGIDPTVTKQTEEKNVIIRDKNTKVVLGKLNVDFGSMVDDLDLSTINASYDLVNKKSVFHYGSSSEFIDNNKVLYVPYSGTPTGEVYICPGVSSLDDVTPSCSNKVTLHEDETVSGKSFNYTSIGGNDYYQVFGITGTGGGEGNAPTLTQGQVDPESAYYNTNYEFSVNYTDLENDTASYVYLELNGETNYTMSSSDTDATDGSIYSYSFTGDQLGTGDHTFKFYAADEANVEVSTTSFSGPTVFKSSNLTVNDSSDYNWSYPYENVYFYAYYTNSSDGSAITPGSHSGSCVINVPNLDVSEQEMNFNTSSQRYYYNDSFSSRGSHYWNVTCSSPLFDNLFEEERIGIQEPLAVPEFSDYLILLIILISVFNFIYVRNKSLKDKGE